MPSRENVRPPLILGMAQGDAAKRDAKENALHIIQEYKNIELLTGTTRLRSSATFDDSKTNKETQKKSKMIPLIDT